MLENLGFTKREKIFLAIVGILSPLTFIIPQDVLYELEPFTLLCVVAPLGFYLFTDPERINKTKGG